MTKRTRLSLFLFLSSCLILGFQNCSKVGVSTLESNAKATGQVNDVPPDHELPDSPAEVPPQEPGEPPVVMNPPVDYPPETPQSPDLHPLEIRCQGMDPSVVPAVVYDSKTLQGTAPVDVSGFEIMLKSSNIDAENIGSISKFAGNLTVTSSHMESISDFASHHTRVNTQTLGSMERFAASQVQIIAHEVGEIGSSASDICISAQKINTIARKAGRLSLYGRIENGQKSTIQSLGAIGGFLSVYNFEIPQGISNVALNAKLVNSHVSKIENAAIHLILVDTIVDEISRSAGTVILKGNSKILKVSEPNALRIQQQ